MAQITIDIPDAKAQEALNHACLALRYQPNIQKLEPDGTISTSPNPLTKAQFVKAHLAQYLKDLIKQGAGEAAGNAARDAAMADVEGITIT